MLIRSISFPRELHFYHKGISFKPINKKKTKEFFNFYFFYMKIKLSNVVICRVSNINKICIYWNNNEINISKK